jgi:predicted glycosyl hydrolase (DUF1957 family)
MPYKPGYIINKNQKYVTQKMATRSTINLKLEDGKFRHVYCHWDGYLENGVGETLLLYYNTIDEINKLMDHGDMSVLGSNIKDCEFYKDRGEDDVEAKILEFDEIDGEQYNYFFIDGKWHYSMKNRKDELRHMTKKNIYA